MTLAAVKPGMNVAVRPKMAEWGGQRVEKRRTRCVHCAIRGPIHAGVPDDLVFGTKRLVNIT